MKITSDTQCIIELEHKTIVQQFNDILCSCSITEIAIGNKINQNKYDIKLFTVNLHLNRGRNIKSIKSKAQLAFFSIRSNNALYN